MAPAETTQETDTAVDLEVLVQILTEHGVAVTGPLAARRVGLGQSNLTYAVTDADGRGWIVRRPPRGHLLASAHDVMREARIMAALGPTPVPVPEIIGRFEDPRLADTPVVVMEHVEGVVLDRPESTEPLPHALRHRAGLSLVGAMAQVHAVDIDAVGLGDLASRKPYAERQLKRWSRQWDDSRTREQPRLEAMTDLLRRSIPEQTETTLVHGDMHVRNVLVDPDDAGIRAVLDWELSTLGDPLSDIGTLLAYWPEAGESTGGVFAASTLPGFATRDELAEAYLEASGRDRAALDYWHVLGLWKIAVIGEGVLRRALDEPSNAAEGGPAPVEYMDHLIERAWDVASRAGLGD